MPSTEVKARPPYVPHLRCSFPHKSNASAAVTTRTSRLRLSDPNWVQGYHSNLVGHRKAARIRVKIISRKPRANRLGVESLNPPWQCLTIERDLVYELLRVRKQPLLL